MKGIRYRYVVLTGQTHRFRLSAPISYRPNNTVLKMSIDTYLLFVSICSGKYVQKAIGQTVDR